MKEIDDLIRLTPEQESLVKEMEKLYLRMENADIAFTMNEDGYLVAYNSKEIEDCELGIFGCPEGFECADQNEMRAIFPLWDHSDIYLKRKRL